jgi:hypothetical protein
MSYLRAEESSCVIDQQLWSAATMDVAEMIGSGNADASAYTSLPETSTYH